MRYSPNSRCSEPQFSSQNIVSRKLLIFHFKQNGYQSSPRHVTAIRGTLSLILAEVNPLRSDSLVKGIRECLARETVGGGFSSLAVGNGLLVSITSVNKSVADELGDDLGIQGAAVVEVGLVGGLERVLLAAVEARAEDDSRVRAFVEVRRVGEGRVTGPTAGSSGDVGKVGLEAKSGVEGVSLSTTLFSLGGRGTRPAGIDSRSGRLAPVIEDVADRVKHDLRVESTTLRELGLVHGLEGVLAQLATLESWAELNGGILAATQVDTTRGYLGVNSTRRGGGGRGRSRACTCSSGGTGDGYCHNHWCRASSGGDWDKGISNPEYLIARRTSLPSVGVTLLSTVEDSAFAVVVVVTLLLLPKGKVFGWLPLVTVDLVAGSKKSSGSLAGS